jgi:hypothetical protein
MGRSKGSRLKGWIESPNALRWRLGQLLGCAFTETESSKIIIGKLGPRRRHAEGGLPGKTTPVTCVMAAQRAHNFGKVRRSRGRLHERSHSAERPIRVQIWSAGPGERGRRQGDRGGGLRRGS